MAFLRGESLRATILAPLTNHAEPGKSFVATDWADRDMAVMMSWFNLGAVLVKPWLDVDVDVHPLDGKSYGDPLFLARAQIVYDIVADAFRKAGLDGHYRAWGRASMGCRGHFIFNCPASKDEVEAIIAKLGMLHKCDVLGVRVMIEVLRWPEKPHPTMPKKFVLPGSIREHKATGEPDIVQWYALANPPFRDGAAMPQLAPSSPDKLRVAIYAAMMTLAVLDHWTKGQRHEVALRVTGVLAHEYLRGGLSEHDCQTILETILDATKDEEAEARLEMLGASLHRIGKQHVYGYTALEEYIGKDWKRALLRLRGTAEDPEALAKLFEIVVRIETGIKGSDCYVDLSAGADRYHEHDAAGIRMRFKQRPEFPKVLDKRGKPADAIEIVLHSDRIRTYRRAVMFPGIPFGTCYHLEEERHEWIETTEDTPSPDDADTAINVASGFITSEYPDGYKLNDDERPILKEALHLWRRFRAHLTQDDPEDNVILDQVIARKLQRVREKQPLGLALVGGQGIGKSFLFNVVLAKLIGTHLIKFGNISELRSDFRFNGVDRALFYPIEECNISLLNTEQKQTIKDLMRNPTVHVNVKHGKIGERPNMAVPCFLSNELNPRLMLDGVADRAMLVVRGDNMASLGLTLDGWAAHKRTIKEECEAFAQALKRSAIRKALLYYFLTIELSDTLVDDAETNVESGDVERALSPALSAILAMLKDGSILPRRRGDPGPGIDDPFPMELFTLGMRLRMRDQGVSTYQTSRNEAGMALTELFMVNNRGRGGGRLDRQQRDNTVLVAKKVAGKGRAYWFRYRRGELIEMIKQVRGILVDPDYELAADGERGIAAEPEMAEIHKSFLFLDQISRGATDFDF